MYPGEQVTALLEQMNLSHVVWLPDSELGTWEEALLRAPFLKLIRVCREGEAWAIAAGLKMGGQNPLVIIQCTGLFESGDAMRNVCFDLKLPLFAIIGYRSYLAQDKLPGDTALKFTEPVLDAWEVPYQLIKSQQELPLIVEHYQRCLQQNTPGAILLAEGKV